MYVNWFVTTEAHHVCMLSYLCLLRDGLMRHSRPCLLLAHLCGFSPGSGSHQACQHPHSAWAQLLPPVCTQRSFLNKACSAVSLLSLQFWMTSSQPCSIGSLWRNCSNPKSSTLRRPWGLSMTAWLMPPSWDWTRPAWIRWADSCLHPPWVAFLVSFVDYRRLESHIMYAKVPWKSERHLWILLLSSRVGKELRSHLHQPLYCLYHSTCPTRVLVRTPVFMNTLAQP